jgi:hypothetical protein
LSTMNAVTVTGHTMSRMSSKRVRCRFTWMAGTLQE